MEPANSAAVRVSRLPGSSADGKDAHARGGQRQRGGQTRRAGADDRHVDGKCRFS